MFLPVSVRVPVDRFVRACELLTDNKYLNDSCCKEIGNIYTLSGRLSPTARLQLFFVHGSQTCPIEVCHGEVDFDESVVVAVAVI